MTKQKPHSLLSSDIKQSNDSSLNENATQRAWQNTIFIIMSHIRLACHTGRGGWGGWRPESIFKAKHSKDVGRAQLINQKTRLLWSDQMSPFPTMSECQPASGHQS